MPQASELITEQGTLLSHDAPAPAPGGDLFATLPMLVLIFAIFYFLVIRPQNKQREEHRKMLAALKKGDEVVTDGGIVGVVQRVDDNKVEVEVSPKVRITFMTESIRSVTAGPQES